MKEFNELAEQLVSDKAPILNHLPQIVYLILDHLADLNVEAQIETRNQILHMAETLTENPTSVDPTDLSKLRWQVDSLISLFENQLYCIAGLNASDNKALQEPHRKAYIQDLLSEAQIAQTSIYRLESRVNDLYSYYQMTGSDRVEKRIRILTILSMMTLPLGIITGLLGMNVGGLPGTTSPYGFMIVIGLITIILGVELWYFKRKGWFG